jgi:hypothetical protein
MSVQQHSLFSSDLAQAVGLVVLEAAAAEDTIGELIVLRRGLPDVDPEWWLSGERLTAALESVADPELEPIVVEMRRLYPERNDVVHGRWLERPGLPTVNAKRNKSTKRDPVPASYSMRFVSAHEYLSQLAADFRTLELMASDAVSDAMGLRRTTTSGLPQREAQVVLPRRNKTAS